jgi:hypothetical protein
MELRDGEIKILKGSNSSEYVSYERRGRRVKISEYASAADKVPTKEYEIDYMESNPYYPRIDESVILRESAGFKEAVRRSMEYGFWSDWSVDDEDPETPGMGILKNEKRNRFRVRH